MTIRTRNKKIIPKCTPAHFYFQQTIAPQTLATYKQPNQIHIHAAHCSSNVFSHHYFYTAQSNQKKKGRGFLPRHWEVLPQEPCTFQPVVTEGKNLLIQHCSRNTFSVHLHAEDQMFSPRFILRPACGISISPWGLKSSTRHFPSSRQ